MANTFKKIQTVTVGSGGSATIEFSSIPQTYTDLKIVVSARSTNNDIDDHLFVKPNNSALNMTQQWMRGNGSTSNTGTTVRFAIPGATATTSTFSNTEFYIPNYTSAVNKDFQGTTVQETNGTEAYVYFCSFLWSDTSAITSLVLDLSNGNFAEYSSATLYGVYNEVKATGGSITTDANYIYHTFTSSGTFTPLQSLNVDYLVVAGGGGGSIGGGGAGGLRCTVGATGGGGSLESQLAVTAQAYTVTVGAGGAGQFTAGSGSNSVFGSITSTGGGAGRANTSGVDGGSGGGGGAAQNDPVTNGGAGTANQGYAGGGSAAAVTQSNSNGGGGGGANAAGTAGTTGTGGNGGNGVATSISGTSTTYAGGGGGGGNSVGGGTGGSGGGGAGSKLTTATAGTANTGGGGGGSGWNGSLYSASGGSGIVIVRYAR